eukprot:11436541-Ditylum_brightwellii.AAC.1
MEISDSKSSMRRGYNAPYKSHGGSCAAKPGVDPPDPKETLLFGSEPVLSNNGKEVIVTSPMHGPNLWPQSQLLPHQWKQDVQQAWAVLLDAARILAKAFALALGEEE